MKIAEFLDRKYHYCPDCMEAFSIKELDIISVHYSGKETKLFVNCPVCHHKIKTVVTKNSTCRKMLEEYLESEEYLSKRGANDGK